MTAVRTHRAVVAAGRRRDGRQLVPGTMFDRTALSDLLLLRRGPRLPGDWSILTLKRPRSGQGPDS